MNQYQELGRKGFFPTVLYVINSSMPPQHMPLASARMCGVIQEPSARNCATTCGQVGCCIPNHGHFSKHMRLRIYVVTTPPSQTQPFPFLQKSEASAYATPPATIN